MKRMILVILWGALAGAPAFADDAHHQLGASVSAPNEALSDGEVRKVDKEAKKITIKHGALKNLDMPAMTMVFQVQDAAMLEQVRPGDKVKFEAQRRGGALVVTAIQPAR
ncbi:MAG: copper-binding protein [Betaproteobacteria bacterium]|nr:copper-binding protein [Betaproteobacteria bacterium]